MSIQRDEWHGLLETRTDPAEPLVIEMPLGQSATGGSGAFLARASDGRRWYVKPQNNFQGGKVIVTEHIVGRVGKLIAAPVCEVAVVRIPKDLAGWEFRPGRSLEPGLTHASLAIADVLEWRSLEHRDRDDNRRRHAGVIALHDWCWADDVQWLYAETDDRKLYSHDHGFYFPDGGTDWSEAALLARVDEPRTLNCPVAGLDPSELEGLAARLDEIQREQLIAVLGAVPRSWPVSDQELEALGFFLERRASAVADRLRKMVGGAL